MQFERDNRNGISSAHFLPEGFVDGVLCKETNGFVAWSSSSSTLSSGSVSPPRLSSSGVSSIEHRVSKMDTLAGIAIKYGVEVADIKRMNSLVTDLQMFAHEKLQIPLPGRHPPSQNLSNGSSDNGVQTSPCGHHSDALESFQSLTLKPLQPPSRRVSSAMSSLQGYYRLTPHRRETAGEGTEMAVYRTGKALDLENGPMPPVSPASELHPSRHRKSRSMVNGFLSENSELAEDAIAADVEGNGEADRSYSEKSVRRRQKADIDSSCRTSDLSVREENGGAFAGRVGKTPNKPKSGGKADLDSARSSNLPIGDMFMANGFFSVRRSSSTSNLHDSDGSSLWPTTKWSLKTDAMTRPLFDGLPKPMTTRRKAALD